MTSISWTDETWNPVTGCSRISEGCFNCYAAKMVEHGRLKGNRRYPDGFFKITEHEDKLLKHFSKKPKTPRKYFVCDMSDLFHQDVSPTFLDRILDVVRANPQHIFQLLTKRADRLHIVKDYPDNVWLGVTVENNRRVDRIEHLTRTNARIKFVSAEPLLEPFNNLSWLQNIDWIIVGGESGRNRRFFDAQWAREIRSACQDYGTAFWFKQHGNKRDTDDDLLDGQKAQEWPRAAMTPK